jgi:hypothetical protein
MFNLVTLISLADAENRPAFEAELRSAAAGLPGVAGALLSPTLPGVFNGGDLIWRLSFADEPAYRRAIDSGAWTSAIAPLLGDSTRVTQIERAAYADGRKGGHSPGSGVYRVALFCANREPTPERLAAWSDETTSMPRYVKSIRSWQLAKVAEASGTRPWTHVWEQEYDDLQGLMGPYMMHPVHWAYVDRWFDPEYPEWLVDTFLCHSFCETRQPALA